MSILLAPNVLLRTTYSVEGDAQNLLSRHFQIILISILHSKPINTSLNNTVWDHAPPLCV